MNRQKRSFCAGFGYSSAMQFRLIDDVLEQDSERIVAIKNVTIAEEYLADHFPSFPVLPGVFMLEALVQAARRLLGEDGRRMVLGMVGPTRYGTFVKPGETMHIEVQIMKRADDGSVSFKGTGRVVSPGMSVEDADTCVTSRFTMRAMKIRRAGAVMEAAGSGISDDD